MRRQPYLLGIDFIQLPTTLLAQVDSSVGGKTGVDFDQYKNMVGAFHHPRLVYMNMATLNGPDVEFFIADQTCFQDFSHTAGKLIAVQGF